MTTKIKFFPLSVSISKLDSNVMKFELESFLSEGKIDPLGYVVGFLNGATNEGAKGDIIFIKGSEDISIGEVYTLVYFQGKAHTEKGSKKRGVYIYSYLSEIKILKEEGNFLKGRITKSIDSTSKGALMIPGGIPGI